MNTIPITKPTELAGSEMDNWMASGVRLLETAEARLLRHQHAYQVERAKLAASQQLQLQELSNKLREERRRFELDHRKRLDDLRRQVGLLHGMRDVGDGYFEE